MNVRVCLWGALVILAVHSDGKLILDRLDQLESNLIENHQAAPPPSARITDRDWVKISESSEVIINARLGARVEIVCEAIGSPAPEIQWFRGNRAVSQLQKSANRVRTQKATKLSKVKSRMVVDCVTRKHEGFYTCSATAGGKTVKGNPRLLLVEGIASDLEICSGVNRQPPRIINWTPTAMLTMGADLQLPCSAAGSPAPTIYWMDPQNNVLNSMRHQVSANGELTISDLAWSDMGEYTCIAENAEGRDEVTTFVYPVMNEQ